MNLFELISQSKITTPLISKKGRFVVDETIGLPLIIASAYKEKRQKYLLITSNLYKAQNIYETIKTLLPNDNILLFPGDELIRAESLAQSKEFVSQRLYTLNEIVNNKADIIIANLSSALRYLPDPKIFKSSTISITINENYNIQELKNILARIGYKCVSKIDQSLQFASRGDILDVFSVNNDNPTRIEFFDNEVESIREFDIVKQTSINKLDSITILPATDILFSEEERRGCFEKFHNHLEKERQFFSNSEFSNLRDKHDEIATKILEYDCDNSIYKYYSFLTTNHFSLLDYCRDFAQIFVDEDSIKESNQLLFNESFKYLEELHENAQCISHLNLYHDLFRVYNLNPNFNIITSSLIKEKSDTCFDLSLVPYVASKECDAIEIIKTYINEGYRIVICVNNNEHINLIEEELEKLNKKFKKCTDFNIPEDNIVNISLLNLKQGFLLKNEKVVFLTGHELFNEKIKLARFDSRFKEATILNSFEDLLPGDYVVHEYQGIGQFLSLETIENRGNHNDYLKIAYYGNEILYVPVTQYQLIRKFTGKEGCAPRLSKLHTKDWENTKKRIKAKVNELAERLMKLYIERSKVVGFAFNKDDEFQDEFEKKFEYPLTIDQQTALDEIKSDMESTHPMDRLLCGDVGFGKTEVAFRAAFKAILSGKQVAILCPTTLLARQHYELALTRFRGFDINIAILSRLIPSSKQKQFINEINEGKTHLIIGTHRLLSKEVIFKDLGLLIIDEEQRFGVEQKERLKELRQNIDVLTLSATPIPRTLQISLLGVRSLSRINTAPKDRMPIQTYVIPQKDEIIKELIERELGRNGQVFYLHNNIDSIYMCANKIHKMIPDALIAVAHGKMEKDDIEDTMMKFYQGDIKILICTSIIENGIDVPNANMIIVENCDHYGLSQLYQIKGRVGRSERIAYAYLMYQENKILNEKAQKRLKAIQDFTELGSGYKIAQRDLMIRGSGDILGPEQAGYIDSIGLDMYIKLLNEAVKEKMEGKVQETTIEKQATLIDINAYIPDSFACESEKLGLYHEILSAYDYDSLAKIKIKFRDIYGKIPKEVESLFTKKSIDLCLKEAMVDDINDNEKTTELILGKHYLNIKGIGNILFEALIPYLSIIKVSYFANKFKIVMNKKDTWLNDLESILKTLCNIQQSTTIKESL